MRLRRFGAACTKRWGLQRRGTKIGGDLAARHFDARGRAEAAEKPRSAFTRAIKEAVAYERILVIEALWQIALADGKRSADEDALLRMVAPMLGINDRDSALARQRVAKL